MAIETSAVVSSFSFLPGRLKTVNFRFFDDQGVVRVFPDSFTHPFERFWPPSIVFSLMMKHVL